MGIGHHIFADRYYTTRALIDYLVKEKTYYTGTSQTNRKGFTPEMKTLKTSLQHKESKFYRCDESGILLWGWKDKKARNPVIAVSTFSVKKESEVTSKKGKQVTKPDIIHDYNFSMNGCNRMDQMIPYYNIFNRRTVKWYKRLFTWCIEVTQINAFILYCVSRAAETKAISLKSFKQMLIKELLAKANEIIPENHKHHIVAMPDAKLKLVPGPSHLVIWVPDDRNCKFCSTPKDRKRTH